MPEWRQYAAYAAANPARGQQTAMHGEHYQARLESRREQFFASAAQATEARPIELGWPCMVVAAEGQIAARFAAALSPGLRERVIVTLDANLGDADPAEVSAFLEPVLEDTWRHEVEALLADVLQAAAAGHRAAMGAAMTLAALAEHRVEHLLIDPARVDAAAVIRRRALGARGWGASPMVAAIERSHHEEVARILVLWTRPYHLSAAQAEVWARAAASRLLALEAIERGELTQLQSASERHARAWDWMLELDLAADADWDASASAAPFAEWLADLRLLGLRPTVLLADGGIALLAEAP